MADAAGTPRYGTVAGVRDLLSRELAEEDQEQGPDGADPEEVDDDVDDSAAALSEASLIRRLNTAANQVDSALAPAYQTPFDPDDPPGLVVDLTEAIAAYLATLTQLQSDSLEKDDPVRLRYGWATDQLAAIAKGDVDVPGHIRKTSTTPGGGAIPGPPLNPISGRMFTPDTFGLVNGGADGGWRVR